MGERLSGPWTIEAQGGHDVVYDNEGRVVADVWPRSRHDITASERAKLIAAAPETKAQRDALLEAALKDEEADRHTLDCPDSYGGCPCDHYWEIKREARIMRQAAIAQAK